jgi:hypothetical protein
MRTLGERGSEEDADLAAVEGTEVDGGFEEAKADGGGGDVEHGGVAHMGQGDAVADAGGLELFAGEQGLQQDLAVDGVGQLEQADHGLAGPRLWCRRRRGSGCRHPAGRRPGWAGGGVSGSWAGSSREKLTRLEVAHSKSMARLMR